MKTTKAQIKVLRSASALAEVAADRFVALATASIRGYGRFYVALSGGTTPKSLYTRLARHDYAARVDWSRVHLFWGDERCVSPDDPRSNYRLVREALIDQVSVPEENVHRIRGEDDPADAAREYERKLRSVFHTPEGAPQRGASFDLVLLGMGADGHTASLLPGSNVYNERQRWVTTNDTGALMRRVTCTPVLFNAAAQILFLVVGKEKAAMVHQVLEGPHQPDVLPAQAIAPHDGAICWLLDADAAANLVQPTHA